MRTKLLLAAVATFVTLSASAAPEGTERVNVVGAQPAQTQLAPMMFDNVQGRYDLEDGRMLTVTGKVDGRNRTLYADMGDGPVELIHIGKSRFVAAGKDLRFAFERPNSRRLPDTVYITNLKGRQVALAQR